MPLVSTILDLEICKRKLFKVAIKSIKQLCYYVEVGCLRHCGASTIGSQLQDGDCTDS